MTCHQQSRGRGATAADRAKGVTRYDALTVGQEAFALAYVRLGNGAEAYRVAFGANMRRKHLGECGRRLRRLPKVARRIAELRGDRAPDAPPARQEGAGRPKAAWRAPQPVLGALGASAASIEVGAPVTVADIENAAVVAFNEAAPDAVRMVALRLVTTGLRQIRSTLPESLAVTLSIGSDGGDGLPACGPPPSAGAAQQQPPSAAPMGDAACSA